MEISVEDFVLFCERTIGGMRRAVDRLDDTTINELPDLPNPNSPFQLVTHALGSCEWWTAHIVCGHRSNRVRDDEFTLVERLPGAFFADFFLDGPQVDMTKTTVPTRCHAVPRPREERPFVQWAR